MAHIIQSRLVCTTSSFNFLPFVFLAWVKKNQDPDYKHRGWRKEEYVWIYSEDWSYSDLKQTLHRKIGGVKDYEEKMDAKRKGLPPKEKKQRKKKTPSSAAGGPSHLKPVVRTSRKAAPTTRKEVIDNSATKP